MSLFPSKGAMQRPSQDVAAAEDANSWPIRRRLRSTRLRAPTGTTSMGTTPIAPPTRCPGCAADGPASTRAPWPGTRRFAPRFRRQAPRLSSGSRAGRSRTWTRTAFPKPRDALARDRELALSLPEENAEG